MVIFWWLNRQVHTITNEKRGLFDAGLGKILNFLKKFGHLTQFYVGNGTIAIQFLKNLLH